MELPYQYFKPTAIFREMLILLLLDDGRNVSQHRLAEEIGVGSTMAHQYLRKMIEAGHVSMTGRTNRSVRYALTPAGRARLRSLASDYSREMARLYRIAKLECRSRLLKLYHQGFHRVVLFGAGESGELACSAAIETPVEVLGVVDNDPTKQNRQIGRLRVERPDTIEGRRPDAVVIAASRYGEEIYRQIRSLEAKGIAIARL